MAIDIERLETEPGYEPPHVAVHGTMAAMTAAAHPGMSMDHHMPGGRPGVSH